MQVFGDRGASRIAFSAYEAHVARLATIVEGRCLLARLWSAIEAGEAVETFTAVRCESLAWHKHAAVVTLEDGRALQGRLLVAADGAESWLRRAAGMDAIVSPYGQKAVVANFACEAQHAGTAFQWFRRDGVLALLPLPARRVSMVWSARDAVADAMAELGNEELCRRVEEASSAVVGALQLLERPLTFPLRLVRVNSFVRPRLALVGDAAHNLHPLAGQGVNLGFQDARQLADVLTQRGACHDVGELRLLRRYERARREAVLAMTLATDGLHRLFSGPSPPVAWLRNTGLSLVDRVRPLKRLLVQHAIA
jgi:ubiquinone biosynthesis UbiH/UbiF/VisC/COQ6 family hydroxylase